MNRNKFIKKLNLNRMNYIFHKKMKILCFDTETTGLIQRGDFGVKLYPHILQISWMVYDTMEEYITTKYDTYKIGRAHV